MFGTISLGIGRWDGDGSISDANDSILRILGYSRGDLSAGIIRWENLTPPEYQPLEQRAMD